MHQRGAYDEAHERDKTTQSEQRKRNDEVGRP
jgi:hypothetical protein